jgi:two-component system response regulator FixJ
MGDQVVIHVVDDDDAVRHAIAFHLTYVGYAVHQHASGTDFVATIDTLSAGPVLLDLRMPGLDGLQVQQALLDRGIAWPIVVLTGHGDIALSVQAMKAGATDFLEKPFQTLALLRAIDEAFARMRAIDAECMDAAAASARLAALTPRERDVLKEMAHGRPNKIIAWNLGISIRTVEVHRAKLMHKLEVRSLSDLLRLAFAAGVAG